MALRVVVESSKSEVQTQMPGMCVLRKRVILVRDPPADFHKLFQTPSCPTALPPQETLATHLAPGFLLSRSPFRCLPAASASWTSASQHLLGHSVNNRGSC